MKHPGIRIAGLTLLVISLICVGCASRSPTATPTRVAAITPSVTALPTTVAAATPARTNTPTVSAVTSMPTSTATSTATPTAIATGSTVFIPIFVRPDDTPTASAAPILVNRHDARVITQADVFNVNFPRDQNANGLSEAGDHFGWTFAAGDLDGDSYTDLILGAPDEDYGGNADAGTVFLLEGSGGGPSLGQFGPIAHFGVDQPGDHFGSAVAAGDINRDGFDDLVVGVAGKTVNDQPLTGLLYVFRGTVARPAEGRSYQQEDSGVTSRSNDRFGEVVAVGDFNGDGYADVAASAPGQSGDAGAVFAFSGSERWLQSGRQVVLETAGLPQAAGDALGAALAAGDFNRDGYDDLAVGVPGRGGAGLVMIVAGSQDGLGSATLLPTPAQISAGAAFGRSLAAADFDGDGDADLAVGAPGQILANGERSGSVYIYRGGASGLQPDHTLVANAQSSVDDRQFGWALAAGDLDADGRSDLAVGAPTDGRTGPGEVFLFAGATGASERLTPEVWGTPGSVGDAFGHSLVITNFDRAGGADLAIGAPGATIEGASQVGAVFYVTGLPRAPVITHGPLLGAVSDTAVSIWARSDQRAQLQVQYRSASDPEWLTSASIELAPEQDFTGALTLTGLRPQTLYAYRLLLNEALQPETQSKFATLPSAGQSGVFRFALGADTYYPDQPFAIFDAIAARQPDFMLQIGDQIYADGPDFAADNKASYERKYKENWADPAQASFMKRFPTFMIWDDHEIENDWDSGKTGRYWAGKAAYDEYQGSHNPPARVAGENYYTFNVADTAFYVLDTRSFRNQNGAPDSSAKTMLGAEQKQDLKNWLLTTPARFKFIVSSVPFHDYGNTGSNSEGPDGWANFKNERAELFNFIRDHCIPGVVLLSGDQHWAGVFRMKETEPIQLYEFMPNPLAVPLRPMTNAQTPDILYKSNDRLAFGWFTVNTMLSPALLTHNIVDTNNNVIYHLELNENDIMPPGSCTPRSP